MFSWRLFLVCLLAVVLVQGHESRSPHFSQHSGQEKSKHTPAYDEEESGNSGTAATTPSPPPPGSNGAPDPNSAGCSGCASAEVCAVNNLCDVTANGADCKCDKGELCYVYDNGKTVVNGVEVQVENCNEPLPLPESLLQRALLTKRSTKKKKKSVPSPCKGVDSATAKANGCGDTYHGATDNPTPSPPGSNGAPTAPAPTPAPVYCDTVATGVSCVERPSNMLLQGAPGAGLGLGARSGGDLMLPSKEMNASEQKAIALSKTGGKRFHSPGNGKNAAGVLDQIFGLSEPDPENGHFYDPQQYAINERTSNGAFKVPEPPRSMPHGLDFDDKTIFSLKGKKKAE